MEFLPVLRHFFALIQSSCKVVTRRRRRLAALDEAARLGSCHCAGRCWADSTHWLAEPETSVSPSDALVSCFDPGSRASGRAPRVTAEHRVHGCPPDMKRSTAHRARLLARWVEFALALVLVALALGGCVSGAPASDDGTHARRESIAEGAFFPLRVDHAKIIDAEGRQVILRGLQHHALQDVGYGGREVEDADHARVAAWGFSVWRMAISWSRLEPTRGVFDDRYVDEVRHQLDLAYAAGLGVILEWHQDLWGRCAVAADDPDRSSANGAPDWTCPSGWKPRLLGSFALFDRLWSNEDGLLDAYEVAFGHLAEAVGAHPAVVGWEPMNEPGGAVSSFETRLLYPAMRRIAPWLRRRGARGLMFVDAPIARGESLLMTTEDLRSVDSDAVFAPHLYSGWLSLYRGKRRVDDSRKELDFELAAEQARAVGLPLWNGEWGVNLTIEGALDDLWTHVGLEDRYAIGSSYWSFSRVYPEPSNALAVTDGAQAILDADRRERSDVVNALARPYPRQIPGRLDRFSFSRDSRTLEIVLAADPDGGPLVIVAPVRHFGSCMDVRVRGGNAAVDVRPEAGRVLVAFDDAATYTVTVAPCQR